MNVDYRVYESRVLNSKSAEKILRTTPVNSARPYSPGDNCNKATDGLELRAEDTQKHYLALEEREFERMGRNADEELGMDPPWAIIDGQR